MRGESALRMSVKKALDGVGHLSWVESHATSAGIPDLNYCINGIEGWVELKWGNFEVKSTQVRWMEDRVNSGGFPLFLIHIDQQFFMVPGSHAQMLRTNNSETSVALLSSSRFVDRICPDNLVRILKNPKGEYKCVY